MGKGDLCYVFKYSMGKIGDLTLKRPDFMKDVVNLGYEDGLSNVRVMIKSDDRELFSAWCYENLKEKDSDLCEEFIINL